jgi:hypothetical protein
MNEENDDEYGCEYCDGGGKLDYNDCCPQCGAQYLDEDKIEAGEHLK